MLGYRRPADVFCQDFSFINWSCYLINLGPISWIIINYSFFWHWSHYVRCTRSKNKLLNSLFYRFFNKLLCAWYVGGYFSLIGINTITHQWTGCMYYIFTLFSFYNLCETGLIFKQICNYKLNWRVWMLYVCCSRDYLHILSKRRCLYSSYDVWS